MKYSALTHVLHNTIQVRICDISNGKENIPIKDIYGENLERALELGLQI